jgi:hypothetical protein
LRRLNEQVLVEPSGSREERGAKLYSSVAVVAVVAVAVVVVVVVAVAVAAAMVVGPTLARPSL